MPFPASPYRSPLWLPEGHSQTIWPALYCRPSRPAYQREIWATPDGGQIAVDRITGQPNTPLVVLFHGLEGSSDSHYARTLMDLVQQQGWHGVIPHFRGCGGVDNALPRAYHAADAAEVRWILQSLAPHYPALFVAGVSLGGSMLLNYLAEEGSMALPDAAVAVSAPLDLLAASQQLDRRLGRLLYTRLFLKTLKPKAVRTLALYPGLFDRTKLQQATTFREFDQLVTAPLHGFRDALDYWTRASTKPRLSQIGRPTLLINAQNDPFLPASALPQAHEVGVNVACEFPRHGGHVGFASGAFPGKHHWLARRLMGYFVGRC